MAERNLNFDEIVDRRNTKCLKYDFAEKRGYPKEILPLWVADMDFRTSSYVEDALKRVAGHNVYGYSNIQHGDGFFDAVQGWMKRHHAWEVREDWHLMTPGVCFAISATIRAVTEPGDAVIIQQPVYYPFYNSIAENGRIPVSSDLVQDKDGIYRVDYTDFEEKIVKNRVKLFILCNPHNPVGRVWTKEELLELGRICQKHHVMVFSDEIHFDFVWGGEHRIFQEVDPSFKEFTITGTSPSKTFNLAGLQQSNIFIPDEALRKKVAGEIRKTAYDEPNIFGLEAAQAAYTHGDEWYQAMKTYVEQNLDHAEAFVRDHLPGVSMKKPEGTYLIWLDFRNLGLDADALDDLMVNKAKLWLDSGRIFGKAGEGFQRINVTCPRSVLEEALHRLGSCLPV